MTTTTTPPLRPSTLTYSKTPPALPPADRSNKGALVVTVLSAYDLMDHQPISVAMNVAGATVRTGPPSARHKDRKNSYRFVTSQVLRVDAPLSVLYKNKATFTLEYYHPNNKDNNNNDHHHAPRQNLMAQLVCKSIPIHETQWLILNLEPSSIMLSSNTTTTTSLMAAAATTTANGNNDEQQQEQEEEDASSSSSSIVTPTLRLQVRLEGPYRTEIAALVSVCNAWFHCVDQVTDSLNTIINNTAKLLPQSSSSSSTTTTNWPNSKFLWMISAVPLLTVAVVLSPIWIGMLIVGLPIVALIGGILLASTKNGRQQIGNLCSPIYHTLLSTPSGQRLVYETGPRPTPVSIARAFLPTDIWGKLLVSLTIDAIGSASYLLPVVGEVSDLVWAPIQTIFIMAMYNTVSPNLKYVSLFEELFPFTDVVPSATIGWATEFGPQLLLPNAAAAANLGGNSGSGSNATNTSSSSSSSTLMAVTPFMTSLMTTPTTTTTTTTTPISGSTRMTTTSMNGSSTRRRTLIPPAPAAAASMKQS